MKNDYVCKIISTIERKKNEILSKKVIFHEDLTKYEVCA